jgi:hypothetical protein
MNTTDEMESLLPLPIQRALVDYLAAAKAERDAAEARHVAWEKYVALTGEWCKAGREKEKP